MAARRLILLSLTLAGSSLLETVRLLQAEALQKHRHLLVNGAHSHLDCDVFEDRGLDITSSLDICLEKKIEWIDHQVEADPLPQRRWVLEP